ncbi:hypothetical protein GUITHDRAFT_151240, partial [Guillardia theta CCMP2712]
MGNRLRFAVMAAVILVAQSVRMQEKRDERTSLPSLHASKDHHTQHASFTSPHHAVGKRHDARVQGGKLQAHESVRSSGEGRYIASKKMQMRNTEVEKTMKTVGNTRPILSLSGDTSGIPDVTGNYDGNMAVECKCWNKQNCDCVKEGCKYVERTEVSSTDELGSVEVSLTATEDSCWKGERGPMRLSLDRCASVMGGARWTGAASDLNVSYFRPDLLHQELDLVVFGNVLGYDDQPAVLRQTVIMRENV